MPILYLMGFIFYVIFYWVYKYLLLKFYQRTNKFNEELPIFSVGLIKFGLIIHLVFGGLMVTYSKIMPLTLTENIGFEDKAEEWTEG
mmetsp:Transcript_11586/g.17530  ORF Transcript_11586/g.17530 Transcript_11586/m.17530 type:complete len:87 (+) Transcript_11586:3148-3408(+)